jgi:hypothetical protein
VHAQSCIIIHEKAPSSDARELAMADMMMDSSARDSTDIENASTAASQTKENDKSAYKSSVPPVISTLDIVKLASEILANLASLSEDDRSADDVDVNAMNDEDFDSMSVDSGSPSPSKLAQASLINDQVLYSLASSITILQQCLRSLIANVNSSALTNAFVEIMDSIDILASTTTNVVWNGNISEKAISDVIAVYMNLLDMSYEVVNNTAKSIDEEGKVIPIWPVHESINHAQLVHIVISTASSLSQAFMLLSKQISSYNEANIQDIAVLLMKGISLPVMEVAVASIEASSSLCISPQARLPTNITVVLTNCLIKRLNNSSAFSAEGRSNTISSLFVIDAIIMSLIDLHSGDEMDVYQVFEKFQVGMNLKTAIDRLSSIAREQASALSGSEKKKIKETVFNGKEFIKYKENFHAKLLR